MGFFDWLSSKIFTEKTLDSLTEKLEGRAKGIILNTLQDEDVAYAINQYTTALGDFLFDRYKKKAFGTLGGLQKGINYAVDDTKEGLISQFLDEDGRPDITQILINAFLGGLKKPAPETFMSNAKIGKF